MSTENSFESPESEPLVTRDAVIEAYQKFVERGVTNPDDLNPHDPEVKTANELFYRWRAQEDSGATDENARQRSDLSTTMLYVDAGFTDPNYLEEVLSEYLSQSAEDAERDPSDPDRTLLREEIAEGIKKVRALLQK
jgi:hypothetical protein